MSFFFLAVEPPALINTVAEPETEERQVAENIPTSVVPLPVTPAPLEAKKPSEESVSIPPHRHSTPGNRRGKTLGSRSGYSLRTFT